MTLSYNRLNRSRGVIRLRSGKAAALTPCGGKPTVDPPLLIRNRNTSEIPTATTRMPAGTIQLVWLELPPVATPPSETLPFWAPHLEQNSLSGVSASPHRVQNPGAREAPQCWQKLPDAGLPHREQLLDVIEHSSLRSTGGWEASPGWSAGQ